MAPDDAVLHDKSGNGVTHKRLTSVSGAQDGACRVGATIVRPRRWSSTGEFDLPLGRSLDPAMAARDHTRRHDELI